IAASVVVVVALAWIACGSAAQRRAAAQAAEAQRVIDGADQLAAMRRRHEAGRNGQRRREMLADGPWRHQTRVHLAPTRLDIRCLDLRDLSHRALRSPSGSHSLVQARMVALRPPMPPVRAVVPWTAVM